MQSLTDDALMAPPSVASVSSTSVTTQFSSAPPTPCSQHDESMRSPLSVMSSTHGMDTDDNR